MINMIKRMLLTWRDFPYRSGAIIARRYRIERCVGQGSFGTAYLAHDMQTDRKVLLKHPRPSKGLRGVELLEVENRLLRQNIHPQIPEWLDWFEWKGRFFLITQFILGTTFDVFIFEEGRLFSERETIGVATHLLRILAALHAHGYVHLDVRLPNVIMSDHHLNLLDFGLARRIGDHPELEPYEDGKLAYRHLAERESDLYAVGQMMLYLLYTAYPVEEDGMVTEDRTWEEELPISSELRSILRRLLKIDAPYSRAEDVLDDLDELQRTQRVTEGDE